WQAAEAIKLLLGKGEPLAGRLLTLDALTGSVSIHQVFRDPGCPSCGESPRIRLPLEASEYEQERSCVR
ncbi:MAG TPA: TOMM precursor leader peptide-binding protein, partial [Candidatus Deferrimicrobiaceae bacterium]|nr:TOMM precursor leader peptide-binding protein [Candidatus Deferrimicrobiaceae bacterium]